jgi:hypothetical protein
MTLDFITYFEYDSEGYLISRTDKNTRFYADKTPYKTIYDYRNGNLIKTTFDTKKPAIWVKYYNYSYSNFKNLVDIESFTGDWLGRINANLLQAMNGFAPMSDNPPCSNFTYVLNSSGFVEKRTTTPCNNQSKYKVITSYKYKIADR